VLRRRLGGEREGAPVASDTLAAPAQRATRRDPRAHEAYLKGRHYWNRRTEQGLLRSVGFFEQAIALSPDDAELRAALADAHLLLGIYGIAPAGEAMPRAAAAAEHALALDPRSAEAHTALACVRALYDWNWHAAEAHFRLAAGLRPDYAVAHQWKAMHLLVPLARFDDASRSLAVARELDPLSPAILTSIGVLAFFRRDHAAGLSALAEVLDLDPDFAAAHHFLGLTHLELANEAEAHAKLERAVTLSGRSAETLAMLAWADARLGRGEEARAAMKELTARAERGHVSPVRLAQILLGLGEKAGALERLEEAVERRAVDLVWLGVHPVYDGIRDDPRFQKVVQRLGLAGSAATRVLVSSRPPPISA
jgi:tetratricopeptide (TPR) repeat protein